MDIKLIPAGNGLKFTFPALPEKVQGKYGTKYQSFDIISQGTVKVPKGTDVAEFTWSGVFFGKRKKNEPIVRTSFWKEPEECVRILNDFMSNGTFLNLIITGTWINVDVTVSSFQPRLTGAYGNIEYSITFAQKKALAIYTTDELGISGLEQTKPRNDFGGASGSDYIVVRGDTLWKIAAMKLGSGRKWTQIYDANIDTIETEAKRRGMKSSDHGHWIWAGEVLKIP